jgi:transcriptional regulator with XRE-family HTH domain
MTCSITDIPLSQPQVDFVVNLPLVAALNPGFHACGMSPLGKTIKARLKALGETQAWLAEEVGVSENAVSKWIKSGEISRENIKPAADALQISVAQLLDPNPMPDMDDRWHSFPPSLKQRVLALVDELVSPPHANASENQRVKRKKAS